MPPFTVPAMLSLVKSVFAKIATVLGAIVIALVAMELALMAAGAYSELAEQDLRASPAIWERPKSKTEVHRHPDLRVPIEVVYDRDGVRNHGTAPTRAKAGVVGVFGDSFTENRRIEDRFSFTTLLDRIAKAGTRVVNFGVDAYGIDQSFLRYRAFADMDLRAVVYVFCENDLRNLYETGLATLSDAGEVRFQPPRHNRFFRTLGKLRLTYLVLTAYHQARALLQDMAPDARYFSDPLYRSAEKFSVSRKQYRKRLRDGFSSVVAEDFLSAAPKPETTDLARLFRAVLMKWKSEVEARGATFHVVLLPRGLDDRIGTKLMAGLATSVYRLAPHFPRYGEYRFKNDVHWNEKGNLHAARVLLADPMLAPFLSSDAERRDAILNAAERDIGKYYEINDKP